MNPICHSDVRRLIGIFASALAVALLVVPSAKAANAYWNLNGTGDWTTAANWNSLADGTGTTGAPGTTDTAFFNTTANNTASVTANLTGALTLGGFDFSSSGTTGIRTAGSNKAITLGASGITINSGAGAVTFGVTTNLQRITFVLGANQTWTNDSSNLFSLNANNAINTTATGFKLTFAGSGNTTAAGIISGAGGVTKNGTGTLTLSAANTFTTGGIVLNAGTLTLGNNAALGGAASVFTINGGTVDVNAARTTTNNNAQKWNGDFTFNGTNTWNTGNGSVTMNASRTVTVSASTMTVSGAIGGVGFGLTKEGAGTLTLNATNTYSGGTTINNGVLSIASTGALPNFSTNGSYSVASGATLAIGTNVSDANLTTMLGTTNFAAGSRIGFDTTTGNRTYSANITDTAQGALGVTVFSTSNVTTLSGINTYTGGTFVNAGTLALSGAGTLGASTGNLTVDAGTLELNGTNQTQNLVSFTNASGVTQNGTLTASSYDAQAGTVSAVLAGSGSVLTKNGTGTLTLSPAVDRVGTTTTSNKTVAMSNTTGIVVGQVISGTGITAGTTVSAITANTSITLSANATASGTITASIGANNTYTGGTVLNDGTLNIEHKEALGTGGFTINGGTFNNTSGATITLSTNPALTLNGDFTFTGTDDLNLGTGAGSLGSAAGTTRQITTTTSGGILTIGGNITDGTTANSITKAGAGTLRLSGNNTFTGGITVNAGGLGAGNDNAWGTGDVTFNAGSIDTSASVTLANNLTFNGNASSNALSNDMTLAGTISGVGNFSFNGFSNGSYNLTGNNTGWSGNITLSGAQIRLGHVNAAGTGTINFAGNAATAMESMSSSADLSAGNGVTNNIVNNNAGTSWILDNNLKLSGVISGNGTTRLSSGSTGTLYLTGNNTYTGFTSIQASTLEVTDLGNGGDARNIGASSNAAINLVIGGSSTTGTLRYTGAGETTDRLFTIGSASTSYNISTGSGGAPVVTLNGTVTSNIDSSGTGALIFSNTGNLLVGNALNTIFELSGSNTGNNTIAAVIGNTSAHAPIVLGNSTTNNGTNGGPNKQITVTDTTGIMVGDIVTGSGITGNVTVGAVLSSTRLSIVTGATLNQTANATLTFTNPDVSLNKTSVVKSGTGTWELTGVNTYTGKTSVNSGTLSFNSGNASATANQALGANTTVDLGVASTSSGILNYTGAAGTLAKDINALGNGLDTIQNSGSGLLTLSGAITKNGTVLTLKGGSNGINVTGSIGGSASGSDLIIDGGLTTLASANTYNGPTFVINGATLTANVTDALPTANGRTAVSMDQTGSGSSTVLLGADQSIASLTGASTSAVNLNANNLTIGTTSGSTTFAGVISGSGSLAKDGASTQILTAANTYNGTTTISAGTLQIGDGGATGSLSTGSAITNNGTLAFSRNNTISQGTDFASVIGGTGAVVQNGSGILVLNGNNTYTGTTTISAGTLQIGAGGATGSLSTSSAITNNGTLAFSRNNTVTQGVDFASVISGTGAVVQNGTSNLILSGNNTYTGNTTINGGGLGYLTISSDANLGAAPGTATAGHLVINDGGLVTLSTMVISSNRGITLGGTTGGQMNVTGGTTLTYGGVIAGSKALEKAGSGVLVLSGNNTYSGATLISAGTLQIGDGNSSGTFGGDAVTNNAAIVFNRSNSLAVANDIGGTGTLTHNGSGTTTLTGNLSYSGVTTVNAGILTFANTSGGNLTTGNVTINGGSFQIAESHQLADTSHITINTGGTFELVGSNLIQTISGFTNDGGDFTTGSGGNNLLVGVGNTINWNNGNNTITTNNTVSDKSWNIRGGTNTVQQGATLQVSSGGQGLNFKGSGTPSITLNSSNSTGGRILLQGNVTVDATLSGTASIVNGGNSTNSGFIDMAGGNRTFTVGNGTASTDFLVSAILSNGTFTKESAGTMALTGNNTYTGETNVNGGTLLVNGNQSSATGNVTVASGATLGGNGTLGGATTIAGILAPGNNDIGTLNIANNVTWFGAATAGANTDWIFDLGAGNTSDLLNITGDFLKDTSLGTNFRFDFAGSANIGTFKLVDWTGTTSFTASEFSFTNLGGGLSGSFAFNGSQLEFTAFSPIPEASTWVGMVALAFTAGVMSLRHRSQVNSSRRTKR